MKALELDVKAVLNRHPELDPIMFKNIPVGLEGIIDIYDLNDQRRGSFQIQVDFPSRHPNGFPSLREISKLIPREIDRHIYNSGNCCVTVLQKQLIESNKGLTLERYFKDYVVPFLANQIHFEEYGEWANEEYKHYYSGQVQFYQETVATEDVKIILRAIEIAVRKNHISRNSKCFCSSTRKYKRCHMNAVQELIMIDKDQLQSDWHSIKNLTNKMQP